MLEMDDVFPALSQISEQIRPHLQQMIDWLIEANQRGDLPFFGSYGHIYKVCDADGTLRCLFKEFDEEQPARKEAVVYLLDHPEDGNKSQSSHVYGFSGVPPVVFVRYTKGNQKIMGVLVEFVESLGNIQNHVDREIAVDEMHRIVVADIRFGNMDRNSENLLVRLDENGSAKLIPIDHELSFSNEAQKYNLCSPYWLRWLELRGNADKAFSKRCMDYVEQIDADEDLKFLGKCGWEPDSDYAEQLRVFAIFLKKAVSQGLTAHEIGVIASFKCDQMMFNLQSMVDGVGRGDKFFANVEIQIETGLRGYRRFKGNEN